MKIYKKWWFWVIIVLAIIILIFTIDPRIFFKPYGYCCGGEAGMPVNRICDCKGIKYTYNPGCCDRGLHFYCFGTTKNCKCFNQTKADELIKQNPQGFKIYNKEYHTYQELIDNAYDSCP